MEELRNKLIASKEELRKSIKNNSAFSIEKLFEIVADLIEFITNTELEEVKSIKESINVKAFCINHIRDLDQYKDNNQFVQGQLYILEFLLSLLSELKKIGDD